MAFVSLFELPEVREILSYLNSKSGTAKEINQEVVIKKRSCSTSTLYRRLKELVVSNILIKEGNQYQFTEFGKQSYNEYLKNSLEHLNSKDRLILIKFKNGPLAPIMLRSILRMSPNEIHSRIKKLVGLGLLKQADHFEVSMIEKPFTNIRLDDRAIKPGKRRRGRPPTLYQLTQKGLREMEQIERYFRKYSHKGK